MLLTNVNFLEWATFRLSTKIKSEVTIIRRRSLEVSGKSEVKLNVKKGKLKKRR